MTSLKKLVEVAEDTTVSVIDIVNDGVISDVNSILETGDVTMILEVGV